MASARLNFSVGLFMTIGMALATVVIIWLGMSSFLSQGRLYVTYFDESVQGLGVDSPVKYRGVPVGRVKSIHIAPDYHLIEVIITIDDEYAKNQERFTDAEAALSNVGITGAMFVEIDKRKPGAKGFSPALTFTPSYPVIASRPSDIRKLFQEIEDIATKIQSVDFQGIGAQAMSAFSAMNTVVTQAQVGAISADIRKLLGSMNAALNPERPGSTAQSMNLLLSRAATDLGQVETILGQVQATIETNRPQFDATMTSLASSAGKADVVMSQGQAAMLQIQSTLRDLETRLSATAENLEQTSAGLNRLISTVNNRPSQLIFSTPKKPRIVEE